MDETNDILETTEITADDDWGDVDLTDLTDAAAPETDDEPESPETEPAEPEADQPKDDAEDHSEPADEQPEPQPTADQRFELKHLDERREVTLEEMKALAQQGMDYARVREERDKLREYESFLKELAGDRTVEELIDEARAATLAQRDGLDRQTALGRVRLERERKAFEAEQRKAQAAKAETDKAAQDAEAQAAAHEKWKQDCFLAFSKEFPDVDPKTIPQDVWVAFNNGETLVSAYRGVKLKELQKEIKNKQQAEDAAKRSTGSRRTDGKDEMSEFDRLWYDDD